MLVKTVAVGAVLASTSLFIAASPQGRVAGNADAIQPAEPDAAAAVLTEVEALREQIAALRAEVATARSRAGDLGKQLEEALDLLEASSAPEPRRNCSPSRSSRRALMTQYQWLRKWGHDQRAARAVDRIVGEIGDDAGRLNSVAWSLMTDKETARQYDEVALALAQRMLKHGKLRHQYLDTVALAMFLNGQVDQAIGTQRQAVQASKGNDEYRRRLRTYEAAKDVAVASLADAGAAGDKVLNEEE